MDRKNLLEGGQWDTELLIQSRSGLINMSAQQDYRITYRANDCCVSPIIPFSKWESLWFYSSCPVIVFRVWRSGTDNLFYLISYSNQEKPHPYLREPSITQVLWTLSLDTVSDKRDFSLVIKLCRKSVVVEADNETGVLCSGYYQGSTPVERRGRDGEVKLLCQPNKASVDPIRVVPH